MAGFCLNYLVIISGFGIPFFIILGVMAFFKSEALMITENNKMRVVISLGVVAIAYVIVFILLLLKRSSVNKQANVSPKVRLGLSKVHQTSNLFMDGRSSRNEDLAINNLD